MTIYDPRCVRCRYARPDDTTTHVDHAANPEPFTETTVLPDGTLSIVGKTGDGNAR